MDLGQIYYPFGLDLGLAYRIQFWSMLLSMTETRTGVIIVSYWVTLLYSRDL